MYDIRQPIISQVSRSDILSVPALNFAHEMGILKNTFEITTYIVDKFRKHKA
jgi:hypothetical protein